MELVFEPSGLFGRVRAPASKSYAQRAIACALLAGGESVIRGYTPCEDSERALGAAALLGLRVTGQRDTLRLEPSGAAGGDVVLDFGGSATSMRIFTSVCCVTPGTKTVTGSPQLLRRPIRPLLEALGRLGAKIEHSGNFQPPLRVYPSGLHGGTVELDASISSQFTSSIMVGATRAENTTTIVHAGQVVSKGYILITAKVLEWFSRKPYVEQDLKQIVVEPGELRPAQIWLEGDYSSAAFLLVGGAITGQVEVENLNPDSLQPDRQILRVLEQAGCKVKVSGQTVGVARSKTEGFECDVTDTPDLAPILAVLAAYSKGTSTIRGVERLRFKESDRVSSILEMLGALRVHAKHEGDAITIRGGEVGGGVVDSKGDHRIAMAAAIAAAGAKAPVTVKGFECFRKSYPGFLDHYVALGGRVRPA